MRKRLVLLTGGGSGYPSTDAPHAGIAPEQPAVTRPFGVVDRMAGGIIVGIHPAPAT